MLIEQDQKCILPIPLDNPHLTTPIHLIDQFCHHWLVFVARLITLQEIGMIHDLYYDPRIEAYSLGT